MSIDQYAEAATGNREYPGLVFDRAILRWFITRPSDLEPLQRVADGGKEGAQFVSLIRRLEAIPAIRNMHPYTDVQLAKALVLAWALFNYDDAGSIPADRRIRVRRLVVVAA